MCRKYSLDKMVLNLIKLLYRHEVLSVIIEIASSIKPTIWPIMYTSIVLIVNIFYTDYRKSDKKKKFNYIYYIPQLNSHRLNKKINNKYYKL